MTGSTSASSPWHCHPSPRTRRAVGVEGRGVLEQLEGGRRGNGLSHAEAVHLRKSQRVGARGAGVQDERRPGPTSTRGRRRQQAGRRQQDGGRHVVAAGGKGRCEGAGAASEAGTELSRGHLRAAAGSGPAASEQGGAHTPAATPPPCAPGTRSSVEPFWKPVTLHIRWAPATFAKPLYGPQLHLALTLVDETMAPIQQRAAHGGRRAGRARGGDDDGEARTCWA